MTTDLDPAFLKAAKDNEQMVLEILDALRDDQNKTVQTLITLVVSQHRTDSWPFKPTWSAHTRKSLA
jgi:hypothetical protein